MTKYPSDNDNSPETSNWPPKSPHEVLLSTPSGRKRLRLLAEPGSPSPSLSKRLKNSVKLGCQQEPTVINHFDNDDDDDDEETLQLQLQEIQARLKLKKLQKRKKGLDFNVDNRGAKPESGLCKRETATESLNFSENKFYDSNAKTFINVPVSPVLKKLPPIAQKSPSRVLLGIDKGLRGSDVSLRRVPSHRAEKNEWTNGNLGPFFQGSGSYATTKNREKNSGIPETSDKPISFNERLAAVRRESKNDQLRQIQREKSKSSAFDIDQNQLRDLKNHAVEFTDCGGEALEFNRDEVLSSFNTTREVMPREKTNSDFQLLTGLKSYSDEMTRNNLKTATSMKLDEISGSASKQSSEKPDQEALKFEPYSSQHLLKRIIPHKSLTRLLSGKKIFLIPDLLREIKAPDFSSTDFEQDLVVLAVIASKSEPKSHRTGLEKQKRGKFMAFTLTDLKWELEFYLFDSAFEKFWKMTPGTIIAILNPLILPPPRDKIDTGKFSLMLNSNADTILEIGTARDLGFCKSVKRDGKICNSWVNKRHTEFCEYHVSARLNKTHASRMEVNTMTFGKGRYNGKSQGNKNFHSINSKSRGINVSSNIENNTFYDQFNHSRVFLSQKRNTARLLDDVDFDPDGFHRGSTKEERMTKRILSKEKEKKLEKKLAEMGTGLGAEYARVRQTNSNNSSIIRSKTIANITTTNGNHNNNSCDGIHNYLSSLLSFDKNIKKDVALSPAKRKKTDTFSTTTLARGWGKGLTDDLQRMKNGENLNKNTTKSSCVVKKTRFMTENGVREAGRESLGDKVQFDESDDDLDIIV
ncbi:putative primase zinc finger [Erysiphe necator]|uniref:Putative primase zinc finger n=1 Tax=Uncinula necator TaxID=52586 RepID=A0A0B1P6T2_UNCNE|nr:putative primase zinc finger [Erysiphe necator]